MANPFADMFVMLPLLYLVNKVDWTTDEALIYSRIFFVTMQTLNALLWLYIYQLVTQRNNTTETVRVPPAPLSGGETVVQSVLEYDLSNVKKQLQQVLISAVIVGVIHFQWGYVQPLVLSSATMPLQVYKNPLFKIFILGEKGAVERRPFKEENPLASFMPQPEAPAENADNNTTQNNNEEKPEEKKEEKKKDK